MRRQTGAELHQCLLHWQWYDQPTACNIRVETRHIGLNQMSEAALVREAALAENTEFFRVDATRKLNPKNRSMLGQFMTPAPISRFMASLFDSISTDDLRVLDPGAGVGSLTAAFLEEIGNRKNRKPKSVESVAYEIEPILIDYLSSTLTNCGKYYKEMGIELSSRIESSDFLEAGASILSGDLLSESSDEGFTHVITNPPYKKINANSPHRKWLRDIGMETSNLYTGFVVAAIRLLKPGGEIVAIVPRSFCNGPYFKPFRDFLLSETALKQIHVFESRTKAFNDDEVLQENIIFHATKGAQQGDLLISSSSGGAFQIDEQSGDLVVEDLTTRTVAFDNVVKPNDSQKFVYLAPTDLDQQIVDRISVFNSTLDDLDIKISTGPVVDFRLRDDIRLMPEEGTVPLLYASHFSKDGVTWPKEGRKPNAIHLSEKSTKWLMPNIGSYVITKRFTSKEERRRIVAWVYDSSLPGELVGFENHLNVFHRHGAGLPLKLARGLSVYLNCTLLDKYFRQFNGHTQVNATDIRSLHYPSVEVLEYLGENAHSGQLSQREIDDLIDEELGSMANGTDIDPLLAQQKIDEALSIVKKLGLPRGQHNERSALTLLAILNLASDDDWAESERPLIGITPIMEFSRNFYGKEYAPNTRETFRRQTMHQFVAAGIALYNPDEPSRPVNSPKACYQISPAAYDVVVTLGMDAWDDALAKFLDEQETLSAQYAKERDMAMIPVTVAEGKEINLTPGVHSALIRDIIDEFAPRYAPSSEVIYVGDTGEKAGYFLEGRLAELGVTVDQHGKMPDVVLYFVEKGWLLLIESVTSHGPVDGKRHAELAELFKYAKPGLVYVTAFPDRGIMGKYLSDISWETEVWCADAPTHLIHFNGERFLGPYS